MAKQSGLGDALYVGGYDVSGDIGTVNNVSGGNSALDFTPINASAMVRQGGVRTGGITYTAYFNPGIEANAAHTVLSALPTSDELVFYCRGTTLGSPAAALIGKQIGYDGTRATDGAFTFSVQTESNAYGLEWGNLLTAGIAEDTTATNGTALDMTTVSTALGWQAYLQVFGITGTSVTLTLQDSADNSTFADLSGGAFTAATGITTQRLQGGMTDTVRRYVRVVSSGTFTDAKYAVVFVRNAAAVSF